MSGAGKRTYRVTLVAFAVAVAVARAALAVDENGGTLPPPLTSDTRPPVASDTPAPSDGSSTSSFRSRKECFHEPVFGDSACVYELNRDAAETVVLVHGINGQAEDWELIIPGLAARYHIIAVDLPGFGASTRANRLYSVDRYASFLRFVIDRYAKRPVHLVGHSLGGAVSLWYAATYPKDVDRLIVADAAGILHRLSLAKLAANRWLADVLGDFQGPGGFVGRWMDKMIGRVGNVPMNAGLVLRTAVTRQRVLGGDPARISAFALAETDFSDVLRRITAPTLVIWGTMDDIASIRTGQVLAARLAHARLVTLSADHMPMRAQPERFLELTLAHLNREDVAPTWPAHPIPAPAAKLTSARCENERHATFEGAFDVLEIFGCSHVEVDNSRIRRLDVRDSNVEITHSIIAGDETAASFVTANVTLTAVDISGAVAMSVDNSNLDLAGVRIEARSAGAVAVEPSAAIFSVSHIKSPNRQGSLHAAVKITAESPL